MRTIFRIAILLLIAAFALAADPKTEFTPTDFEVARLAKVSQQLKKCDAQMQLLQNQFAQIAGERQAATLEQTKIVKEVTDRAKTQNKVDVIYDSSVGEAGAWRVKPPDTPAPPAPAK